MINNVLRIFLCILFSSYVSCAIGGETALREQYTVKINDIPMTRDSAESILGYISKNNSIEVVAHDNVKNANVLLSVVEKNMDVRIEDIFVAKIVELYNICLNENTPALFASEDRKCVLYKLEGRGRINMCIDKKNKTIIVLGII
jgi:hypothetical protein